MSERIPPSTGALGDLRRFETLTEREDDLKELEHVIAGKGLTRRDLALILFFLRVRSGFDRSDFGI